MTCLAVFKYIIWRIKLKYLPREVRYSEIVTRKDKPIEENWYLHGRRILGIKLRREREAENYKYLS